MASRRARQPSSVRRRTRRRRNPGVDLTPVIDALGQAMYELERRVPVSKARLARDHMVKAWDEIRTLERSNPGRAANPKRRWKPVPPYRVDTWEERDRLQVSLYDGKDREVASWWDDDARQMFEDGFFSHRGRGGLEGSVIEYAKSVGLIP